MPGGAVIEREVPDTRLIAGVKALNAEAPEQKFSNDRYDKAGMECFLQTTYKT
jgi:hypothetical protein